MNELVSKVLKPLGYCVVLEDDLRPYQRWNIFYKGQILYRLYYFRQTSWSGKSAWELCDARFKPIESHRILDTLRKSARKEAA